MHYPRYSVSLIGLAALSACGGGSGVSSSGTTPPSTGGTDTVPPAATPAPTPGPTATPTPTDNVSEIVPSPGYAAPVAPPDGSILTPASMQPTRSANDTAEFRQNYIANELVNGLFAADSGWTGQGVTVGVLDDGVNVALSAFSGQISVLSRDFGYETRSGVVTKRNSLGDSISGHGTAVAGIIAARRDGSDVVGLASDARIAVLRTSDYDHDSSTEMLKHDPEALNYAAAVGIKVVNRSLVSPGVEPALQSAVRNFTAVGGLLVNAAGNGGGASPIDAVNVDASNRDGWLFVVALDPQVQSSYALASYSNKAGIMADRTVTAAGTNVTTMADGSLGSFSGTSSATAQVTALAATILSKWPQLSGIQAGQVILETARDIGAAGTDAIFGRGLIDFRAALSPVSPTLSNGSRQTAVEGSVMVLPDAIGSASLQAAVSNVTVIDKYGRDFSGSLAGLVVKPEAQRSTWLRQRMGQLDGGRSDFAAKGFRASLSYASYRGGPNGTDRLGKMVAGDVSYRAHGLGVKLGFNAQDSLQNDIMGLAPFADGVLTYAPFAGNSVSIDRERRAGRIGITLASGSLGRSRARAATASFGTGATEVRLSMVDERGSIFGVQSVGALSLGRGARTGLIEMHHRMALSGGWSVEGYGSLGITRLKIDGRSIVTGASLLIGSRAGVQASGPVLGGVVSFGVAQPLTVESGSARLTMGAGYDLAARSLLYRTVDANLTSTLRRVQLTAGYAHQSADATLRLGVMQDMANGSTRALAAFSTRF